MCNLIVNFIKKWWKVIRTNYLLRFSKNMKIKDIVTNAVTLPAEYTAKAAAIPGAALAAGSKGTLVDKIGEGFTKLTDIIPATYAKSKELYHVAQDADTMTAREFATEYGANATQATLDTLNGVVDYAQQFYLNISSMPITTVAAAAVVGGLLYTGGRVARFIRQKGRGGIADRLERKLGEKIWKE